MPKRRMEGFTWDELEDIEIACRFRVEACKEKKEIAQAHRWQRIADKAAGMTGVIK